MDKYQFLGELGDGTSGDVFKALNKETNEVAVKKMKRKFYCWEECINLPEVKSLSRLKHPNIVKLKEVISENHELFFIFEYMECNLFHIMKGRQLPFSAAEIRNVMFQVLQGLAYMHNNGYFHRDLKPENLLVTGDVIKIADFGLAREVSSRPPYTDYVSTRWYRAPEVLLQSSTYTPAIDMWAVGAIIAELFTLCPLFPGESETDQVYKICAILGTPNHTTWADGMKLSLSLNFSFFEMAPVNLAEVIPQASTEALDLIARLCSWDPQKRPTAEQSLQHPFFHVNVLRPPPTYHAYQPDHRPKLELNLWDFDTDRNDCYLKLDRNDCFLGLTLGLKPSASDLELNAPFRRLGESGFLDINRMDVNYEHYPATSGYLPPMNLNRETGLLVASSSMPSLYFFKSPILPPEERDPVPTELKLAVQSMWDWPCV